MKKGVPIRLEIGPKEYESKSVYLGRRDKSYKDKVSLSQQMQLQLMLNSTMFVGQYTKYYGR